MALAFTGTASRRQFSPPAGRGAAARAPARLTRVAVTVVAVAVVAFGACSRRADAGSDQGDSALRTDDRAKKVDGGAKASRRSVDANANLETLDTEQVRQAIQKARGRGQVLFVHLWATWCAPCLDELPVIDRFARAARARGASVLAISLDSDYRGIARIPTVLRARAPSLNAAVANFKDPDEFMALFGNRWHGSIPATFAFDRAGQLQGMLLGDSDQSDLDVLLDQLLGSPVPRP